MSARQGFTTGG